MIVPVHFRHPQKTHFVRTTFAMQSRIPTEHNGEGLFTRRNSRNLGSSRYLVFNGSSHPSSWLGLRFVTNKNHASMLQEPQVQMLRWHQKNTEDSTQPSFEWTDDTQQVQADCGQDWKAKKQMLFVPNDSTAHQELTKCIWVPATNPGTLTRSKDPHLQTTWSSKVKVDSACNAHGLVSCLFEEAKEANVPKSYFSLPSSDLDIILLFRVHL